MLELYAVLLFFSWHNYHFLHKWLSTNLSWFCISGERQINIRLNVWDQLSWKYYTLPEDQTSNPLIEYLKLSLLKESYSLYIDEYNSMSHNLILPLIGLGFLFKLSNTIVYMAVLSVGMFTVFRPRKKCLFPLLAMKKLGSVGREFFLFYFYFFSLLKLINDINFTCLYCNFTQDLYYLVKILWHAIE